jgi:hypothetical protein
VAEEVHGGSLEAAACRGAGGSTSAYGGVPLTGVLVVVLAMLMGAALLLPTVSGDRERARRAICADNLRQMVMAVQMYAADWDGVPTGSQGARLLNGRLEPYGAIGEVLVCPSDPGNAPNIQPGPCALGGNTSYLYFPQRWRCDQLGLPDPVRLAPESPVFLCKEHLNRLGTNSVARYDGSVWFQYGLPDPKLIPENHGSLPAQTMP